MTFSENGTCIREGYGLYYEGTDEEAQGYQIYESSQVEGVKIPTKFLAIYGKKVLDRRKSKQAAIEVCKEHREKEANSVTVKRRKPKLRRGL